MLGLLESGLYKSIPRDPSGEVRRKLLMIMHEVIAETNDDKLTKISKQLYFHFNCHVPELYGLPKIRTEGVPIRPVITTINTVTSRLCTYLKDIINPLLGTRLSHVKNSKEFVTEIRNVSITDRDIMVSYDVKNLFTSIPIECTLNRLEELLSRDETLKNRTKLNPHHVKELVSFCTSEANFFRFQRNFFLQKNGAPMGSSLSPAIAEIFMEYLEELAFYNNDNTFYPKIFKRYVDDIFAIIERGKEDAFLGHLNGLFPEEIVFTIEKETNGVFLKVELCLGTRKIKSRKSNTIRRTQSPVFNESFNFKLSPDKLDQASLIILVCQSKSDKVIARLILGGVMFTRNKPLQQWQDMMANMKTVVSEWHFLTE
uniref:Reverse transcriptase domain-containing protein n=1 Tax=Trichuris muris TaxID=70415 RepID=A0A5S6QPK8_TRIMR